MKRKAPSKRSPDKSKGQKTEGKVEPVLDNTVEAVTKKTKKLSHRNRALTKEGKASPKHPIKGKEKEKIKKTEKKFVTKSKKKTKKEVPPGKVRKAPPKAEIKIKARSIAAGKTVEKGKGKFGDKRKIRETPEKTTKKVLAEGREIFDKKMTVEVKKSASSQPAREAGPRDVVGPAGRKVNSEIKKKGKLHPTEGAKYPAAPWEMLPSEYGESGITLMTVNPNKIFAFWEVGKEAAEMTEGGMNIRVYDVTDADFKRKDASDHFDVSVQERVGARYLDVRPEREFVADIGIFRDGIFVIIARSYKVSTPRAGISSGALPPRLLPIGY